MSNRHFLSALSVPGTTKLNQSQTGLSLHPEDIGKCQQAFVVVTA